MILYHGSNVEVQNPRIITTNRGLDFGSGFYLTSDVEQATRWSILKTKRRGSGMPILSVFEFDNEIKKSVVIVRKFNKPNREWLNLL